MLINARIQVSEGRQTSDVYSHDAVLVALVLNRPTQHWYTDSTRTQVTAVGLGHRVYESPVE
jgi:hypothetical protein